MKRIVAFILAALMISSAAIADEILFRGLPWGCTPATAIEGLAINGFPKETPTDGASIMSLGQYSDSLDKYGSKWCKNGGCQLSYYFLDNVKVAGHEVAYSIVYFAYPELDDSIFPYADYAELVQAYYTINATDKFAVYEDLESKLSGLYGTPETFQDVQGYFNTNYDTITDISVWQGDNNTAVVLKMEWNTVDGETESKQGFLGEDNITLLYSKTDLDERIDKINKYWEDAALQAEKETIANNASNTDGL